MFEAYKDELHPWAQTPVPTLAPSARSASPTRPLQPRQAHPSMETDYEEIPIEEFGAYLAARDQRAAEQPAPIALSRAAEASSAALADVDLNGFLGLIGTFLSTNGPASTAHPEDVPDSIQPYSADDVALQFVAKRRLTINPFRRMNSKTMDLIGHRPSRRKFAAIGGLACLAALAVNVQSHRDPTELSRVQLAAPASLMNQGAVIASMDLQSRATVRIPVAGFSKPLLFKEKGQAVEPAATLNDTISITLAPRLDKKGNALPIAVVRQANTFEVNRSNIEVIANFDNFLGLNIDCIKDATTVPRYCVAGSPVKLQASGNFKAATANKLNDLLTTKGKNFDTYYRGVKAQIAVAGLAKAEQGACGNEIFGLADQVITSLLQKQSASAKIQFAPTSHYPSISQDYAVSFTGLVANNEFSIERGDSPNAIPDSLQVACKVTPSIIKGAKK
ncbi:MAG: hypothetical protein ABI602_01335 [Candidatus Saccharibacteria bacterium]